MKVNEGTKVQMLYTWFLSSAEIWLKKESSLDKEEGRKGRIQDKVSKRTAGLAMKENKQPTEKHNLKGTLKLAHLGKLWLGRGKAGEQ